MPRLTKHLFKILILDFCFSDEYSIKFNRNITRLDSWSSVAVSSSADIFEWLKIEWFRASFEISEIGQKFYWIFRIQRKEYSHQSLASENNHNDIAIWSICLSKFHHNTHFAAALDIHCAKRSDALSRFPLTKCDHISACTQWINQKYLHFIRVNSQNGWKFKIPSGAHCCDDGCHSYHFRST